MKPCEYPGLIDEELWNVIPSFMLRLECIWDDSALPHDVQVMFFEACRCMAEVHQNGPLGPCPWDFAGYLVANGYHNISTPFIRYPHLSPDVDIIRSSCYRIYLFVLASARNCVGLAPKNTRLGKAKIVGTILVEYPLLEFPGHISSAIADSCLLTGNIAAQERTEVLALLAALTFPLEIKFLKLFKQLEILSQPRKFVENFFQCYPHSEERILLTLYWSDDMFGGLDRHGPNWDKWSMALEFIGPRIPNDFDWDGDVTRFLILECDTEYAAEMMTLGRASQWKNTSEEMDMVTDKNGVWRRAAGSKRADPKILVFGGYALSDLDGMPVEQFWTLTIDRCRRMFNRSNNAHYLAVEDSVVEDPVVEDTPGMPANCGDADRVLSHLRTIYSTEDGSFMVPGLTDSLRDIKKRQIPIGNDGLHKLVNDHPFKVFAQEFMWSFKTLTTSADLVSHIVRKRTRTSVWKDRDDDYIGASGWAEKYTRFRPLGQRELF